MSIAIIDYGMGNLHSVAKALQYVGAQNVIITNDNAQILSADKVVLPGVGAMGDCMAQIKAHKLKDVIKQVSKDRPFLGICVGMQALMQSSSESGNVDCLGLFSGKVIHFNEVFTDQDQSSLKVPHMGWNKVKQAIEHPLWHGISNNERFYFVHSYLVAAQNTAQIAGICDYGVEFAAAIWHNYIFAVQFHPEKSHAAGLQLLKNFINWQ